MKFPREREYQTKYRVCWGLLQTRKDTRQVLEPLYNCPFGIQAPKLETRINWNFQFLTALIGHSRRGGPALYTPPPLGRNCR